MGKKDMQVDVSMQGGVKVWCWISVQLHNAKYVFVACAELVKQHTVKSCYPCGCSLWLVVRLRHPDMLSESLYNMTGMNHHSSLTSTGYHKPLHLASRAFFTAVGQIIRAFLVDARSQVKKLLLSFQPYITDTVHGEMKRRFSRTMVQNKRNVQNTTGQMHRATLTSVHSVYVATVHLCKNKKIVNKEASCKHIYISII